MSVIDLLEPLLDGGLERNNFFNGRLLSAEDLRAEQDANRLQQSLLARAAGDGVAWGLTVSLAHIGPDRPRVNVTGGVAMNRLGNLLRLTDPVEVAIVRSTAAISSEATGLFAVCDDLPSSSTLSGSGAYVLAIAPTSGFRGSAPVSDPNTTLTGRGSCGARFSVEGVQFRLVPIETNALQGIGTDLRARIAPLLPPTTDTTRERLRNLLAHACFGSPALGGDMAAALELDSGTPGDNGWGLVEAMRRRANLTDCDVPLAVIVLKPGGISFVDTWSVRRRLLDAGAIHAWRGVAGPRRIAEGEAAFLQFQSQLQIVKGLGPASAVSAVTYFDLLPASGWLPTGTNGFNWPLFLGPHAPPGVTPVDAALLRGIVERSWFDESFALSTDPPVPLRVFEVPGQSPDASFVVFARSSNGAIRVFLTPAPTSTQQVEVKATARTGVAQRATTRSGGTVIVPELAPGPHSVTITAADYVEVSPRQTDVIGGRPVDLRVTLTPLPNGSIRVETVDSGGKDIAAAVTTVTATAGSSTHTAVRQGSRWLLTNLPAATYTITGSARGFKVATRPNVGPTAPGQDIDTRLVFAAEDAKEERPGRCVNLKKGKSPIKRRSRLCLVLQATEFEQRFFYEGKEGGIRKGVTRELILGMEQRRGGERAKGRFGTEDGFLVYREEPWDDMVPVDVAEPQVTAWLLAWRAWFAKFLRDESILDVAPRLYLDRGYAPPEGPRDIPRTPVGYAVFKSFGVPVAVKPADGLTKARVEIDRAQLKISNHRAELLRMGGIGDLEDLAWGWTELIADAIDEPEADIAFLIAEAMERIYVINQKLGFLEDISETEAKAMEAAGYVDEVAIANADVEKLGKIIGSKYAAARAIRKAREIVTIESWSLEELGLPPSRIDGLKAIGIDSMGTLMANAGTTAGKAALTQVFGLAGQPAAARDQALADVANAAATAMARGSVTSAVPLSVARWDKVDSATANRLAGAGLESVEDVANADAAELATTLNVAPAVATRLVEDAKKAGRAALPVGTLAVISKTEEQKLNTLLGGNATIGGITAKTPAELAEAFAGNEARAAAVLNGIRAGLLSGGIR